MGTLTTAIELQTGTTTLETFLTLIMLNVRKKGKVNPRLLGGMLPQLWDGFIWLTLGYGNVSLKHPPLPTSPCWKQLNHTKDNQPNNTRKLDWMSYENCQCTISLKDNDCYGTD